MENALAPIAEAISSLGHRLRLVFDAPPPDLDPEPSAVVKPAEVEFTAYAEDCVLSGFVRLGAERLTDLLNAHDEYELVDIRVEDLTNGAGHEIKDIVVKRDELLLIHASGPRGLVQRRVRTRQFRVRLKVGPYTVRGDLHCPPGADPVASFRRRRSMVPLTNATIEFVAADVPQQRLVSSLIVNRHLVDWIVDAPEEDVEAPVAPLTAADPNAKDMTGYVRTDPFASVPGDGE
jgi:hypothetical protein